MLKVRLIPSLLLREGRCVKGVRFGSFRDTGNPVTAAKIYDAQGADELLFLDITASTQKRSILFNIVARTAEECFMPLCVGGGIRTTE
ncbi:MAG TPA: HisA/HisF-related TIM barrel protein, partial [Candidatus Bilamarchaeaceae archaeon]|nr:HisA/HisF-related TIM barrel protein [Candidatus Bilamarchaeaceae archaeon]